MKLRTTTLTEEQKKDRNFLLRMIWLNYVVALPVGLQVNALDYYDQLIEERSKVISWLQSKIHNTQEEKLSPRATSLIKSAHQRAFNDINAGKYKKEEYDLAVKNAIEYYINNEHGTSLYSLIKSMKNKNNDI
jgi:hypothetical protein